MYARMVIGKIVPEKLDEAIKLWKEIVLPSAQQQKGFRSVRLMVDRNNGKIATTAIWNTEADFQATVKWNEQQITRFSGLFDDPPVVSGYEVIFDV